MRKATGKAAGKKQAGAAKASKTGSSAGTGGAKRITKTASRRRPLKPNQRNIALILAAGFGSRANLSMPKQFAIVEGKPVIVHTLETFNNNRQIDEIVVVILEGWEAVVDRYIENYGLDKVKRLVTGGVSGQESIRNGMHYLRKNYRPDDIIIIHDSVRPLVTDEIINSNISGVLLNGNAVTVIPATEALLYCDNSTTSERIIDRATTLRTQTPQSLRLRDLIRIHEEADRRGIHNSVATCTLLVELGETVHFAKGDNSNFKITTGSDIRLFAAYLKSKEEYTMPKAKD